MTGESVHGGWLAYGFQTYSLRFVFTTRLLREGKLADPDFYV